MELKAVLEALNEPIKTPENGEHIREAFDTFMETMTNGKVEVSNEMPPVVMRSTSALSS